MIHLHLIDGKWFFILRDNREAYIGCIKDGNIRIWNAITTVEATVDVSAGTSYLTNNSTQPDRHVFDVLTIQDVSIITNKETVVTAQVCTCMDIWEKRYCSSLGSLLWC